MSTALKKNKTGSKKNIVIIGGGTGTFTVLSGLKNYFDINLSAVVSVADDGGSTGILRQEPGVMPPGAIRPALAALLKSPKSAEAFNFRFTDGLLKGHNVGNLLIYLLSRIYGDPEKAIEETVRILRVKGDVIPSTLDNARLYAKLEDGSVIAGETNIDVPKHDGKLRIIDVWFDPPCEANPRAVKAIKKADLIVIGPGDLFSSIVPNFLAKGIPQAVRESRAKKVYVCNLMTKFGETYGFSAKDFIGTIEKFLEQGVIDAVVLNRKKPSKNRVVQYEKEGAQFVEWRQSDFRDDKFKIISGDFMRPNGFIRHHSDKLAKLIVQLAQGAEI